MANKAGVISVLKFLKMKQNGEKIAAATAYDYPTALLADEAGVDLLLVGDSLGTVVQGRATTLGVTLDQTIYHTEMVARAARRALVVADMPFPCCQLGPNEAIRACARVLKETEATAVKIEGGKARAETVRAVVQAGIPVLGHCGLAPQSVNALGGYKVQRDREQLFDDATAIQEAGAFAVVVECVEREAGADLSKMLTIPTIGIGAGNGCDGQILVFHDLFNFSNKNIDETPKHARVYSDLHSIVDEGFKRYIADVKEGRFPGDAESFAAKK